MGRGDNRQTPKMKRKRSQAKLKARIKRKIETAKAAGDEPQARGVAGVAAGALTTAVYASTKGWDTVIPALAWGGGLGAAFAIGALAGLLPALRAARMSPTEALRTV